MADHRPELSGTRYILGEALGQGGMGEVWRVYDPDLDRKVAIKVLRADLREDAGARARFVAEARITADLQHPGIVAVHEIGRLADGRPYYTMQEVQGRDLRAILLERAGSPERWPLRAVVDVVQRACAAVAFAHTRGVVHRDLKPSNVMVGEFGDVRVVDWGIAEFTSATSADGAGTRGYRAPETLRPGPVHSQADVYALGVMLYEAVSEEAQGRAATTRTEWDAEDAALQAQEPRGIISSGEALLAIARRATHPDPAERFRHAGGLAQALHDWADNVRRREEALVEVERAREELTRARSAREQAAEVRSAARLELRDLPPWTHEDVKAPVWDRLEQAEAKDADADRAELRAIQALRGALTVAPDLTEAHSVLASHYRQRHRAAEARGDRRGRAHAEQLLRTHAHASEQAQAHLPYLEGLAAITLHTEPPGAHARLFRYETHRRRRVARWVRDLGRTPLIQLSVPHGSYRIELQFPGRPSVVVPVQVDRMEHWENLAPGRRGPHPIPLPEHLDPDEIYVPPGWFRAGGAADMPGSEVERRLWVDGFIMQRVQATHADWIAFLDALVDAGRELEALRYAPALQDLAGDGLDLAYARDAAGHFHLTPDPQGQVWHPRWPVFMIDWVCATAYARFRAAQTGLPWRLPAELEWEKAARGVDGRIYPFGDFLDPSWCVVRDSHAARPSPSTVDDYAIDESPYGVRGMAGNQRDWCADSYSSSPPPAPNDRVPVPGPPVIPPSIHPEDRRVARGGLWSGDARAARATTRNGFELDNRYAWNSVRLVRSWGG